METLWTIFYLWWQYKKYTNAVKGGGSHLCYVLTKQSCQTCTIYLQTLYLRFISILRKPTCSCTTICLRVIGLSRSYIEKRTTLFKQYSSKKWIAAHNIFYQEISLETFFTFFKIKPKVKETVILLLQQLSPHKSYFNQFPLGLEKLGGKEII